MFSQKYARLIRFKHSDYAFSFKRELMELMDLMLLKKKNTLKKLKKVSTAPILSWIDSLTEAHLEKFALDVYFVDLMDIFGEICHKIYIGVW